MDPNDLQPVPPEQTPALLDYLASPDAVFNDKDVEWRYGKVPDYKKTREAWSETKTMDHAVGSLPQIVENLVKNWEVEASFKSRLGDWRTIDPASYSFAVNGSPPQSAEYMLSVGTYNALIPPNDFYCPAHSDFASSHKTFKRMMPTFAWEVIEVYSGPPTVAFKWRHWGEMKNDYVGFNDKGEKVTAKAHGGLIEVFGVTVAHVDDAVRLQKVDTWFDPLQMFRQIAPDGVVNRKPVDMPITDVDYVEVTLDRGEIAITDYHETAHERYDNGHSDIEERIATLSHLQPADVVNGVTTRDIIPGAEVADATPEDEGLSPGWDSPGSVNGICPFNRQTLGLSEQQDPKEVMPGTCCFDNRPNETPCSRQTPSESNVLLSRKTTGVDGDKQTEVGKNVDPVQQAIALETTGCQVKPSDLPVTLGLNCVVTDCVTAEAGGDAPPDSTTATLHRTLHSPTTDLSLPPAQGESAEKDADDRISSSATRSQEFDNATTPFLSSAAAQQTSEAAGEEVSLGFNSNNSHQHADDAVAGQALSSEHTTSQELEIHGVPPEIVCAADSVTLSKERPLDLLADTVPDPPEVVQDTNRRSINDSEDGGNRSVFEEPLSSMMDILAAESHLPSDTLPEETCSTAAGSTEAQSREDGLSHGQPEYCATVSNLA